MLVFCEDDRERSRAVSCEGRASQRGWGYKCTLGVGNLPAQKNGSECCSSYLQVCSFTHGRKYDEEEVDYEESDYEESDSDKSWTTESTVSSESILSSTCTNGGDEKPFACPVPGCEKRYKASRGDPCGQAG
ncbi:hypothetical protein GN956_G9603 [Arapaima gigas]